MNVRALMTIGAGFGLLLACGPQPADENAEQTDSYDTAPQPTPEVSERELPGNQEAPGDLGPIEAEMRIDDVTVGHMVAEDGSIPATEADDEFEAGETVHLAMAVEDTPEGSAIEVVWLGPEDQRIGEQVQTVEPGQDYLAFTTPDTSSWAVGDYTAEIWIGDEKVASESFQIVSNEAPATENQGGG